MLRNLADNRRLAIRRDVRVVGLVHAQQLERGKRETLRARVEGPLQHPVWVPSLSQPVPVVPQASVDVF